MIPQTQKLLKRFKEELVLIYGEQLDSVYLFGSYARGDSLEGSDLDILVVLRDFPRRAAELKRVSRLIGELSLEYEITVNPLFIRASEWKADRFPVIRHIKQEGVAV